MTYTTWQAVEICQSQEHHRQAEEAAVQRLTCEMTVGRNTTHKHVMPSDMETQ